MVPVSNGNKKLYSITEAGEASFEENASELVKIKGQIDKNSTEISGVAIGNEVKAFWPFDVKFDFECSHR